MRYLWDWFQEISLDRTSGGFSINPIAYAAIDAWSRLMGVRLQRWEVRALKMVDAAFMIAMAESSKPEPKHGH